jgi:hypothetical protein
MREAQTSRAVVRFEIDNATAEQLRLKALADDRSVASYLRHVVKRELSKGDDSDTGTLPVQR